MKGRVYITHIIRRCLWLLLAGCPAAVPDAGSAIEASDAATERDAGPPAIIDAGPPGPAELAIVIESDGGRVDDEVDAVRDLEVRIPVVLRDYRVRVFDDSDRVVPSDDLARDSDGGIDYTIIFSEPLRAGHKYRLTVEAQRGEVIDDAWRDCERRFKVRGEPEKAPASAKKKKKR